MPRRSHNDVLIDVSPLKSVRPNTEPYHGRNEVRKQPPPAAPVLYLRYHGYSKFFPLWALARCRNLKRGNSRAAMFGM